MQFARFLTVGLANSALGYAIIFGGMGIMNWSPEMSNIIGYSVGGLVSFGLNRSYTFRAKDGQLALQATRFLLAFGISFAMNFATLYLLLKHLMNGYLAQIIAGVVYVAVSFLLNKFFVFHIRTGHAN